jgi:hypothetical protein
VEYATTHTIGIIPKNGKNKNSAQAHDMPTLLSKCSVGIISKRNTKAEGSQAIISGPTKSCSCSSNCQMIDIGLTLFCACGGNLLVTLHKFETPPYSVWQQPIEL